MNREVQWVQGVLFDLDGVVWRGREPVPGAAPAIAAVKEAGLPVRFVSNHSSLARRGAHRRLLEMGVPAEEGEEFIATRALARARARRRPRAAGSLLGAGGVPPVAE